MPAAIEIRDPHIDAAAVLQQLYANLSARQALAPLEKPLPDFGLPPIPEIEESALRYHLHRANRLYDQLWVPLSLAPSPATRIPLVGRVWGLVRESLHRLILYYLEMAISKQAGFNSHVVGALNSMAGMQSELAMLRQEVRELRRRVAAEDDSDASSGPF